MRAGKDKEEAVASMLVSVSALASLSLFAVRVERRGFEALCNLGG